MKNTAVSFALVFFAMLCFGQQINRAEYFIDTDPGYGLATEIPINSPGNNLILSFDVDVSALSQGFHMMVLRARDDLGRWSNTCQHVFYVFFTGSITETIINKAEYFIDTDPGYGFATDIPISTPDNNLILSFDVDVSELSQGFHMMVIRAHDDLGRWSNTHQHVFYVFFTGSTTEARVDKAEYFINTDPGYGFATEIPIAAPEYHHTLNFEVDVSELNQGFHMIVLRARDDLGRWGNTRQQVFYVFKSISPEVSDISGIEYFVDNDPGFGNGSWVNIETPGNNAVFDFFANMDDLSEGDHVLYLRAKDALGRWSHTYMHAFSLIISDVGNKEITSWLKIYPNPNQGNFTIDFSDLAGEVIKLKIVDLNGRTVYSNELHGETMLLSLDLQTGIYLLTVEAGNKTFIQKLVINK